jgi:predicted dehydrogenase
VTPVRIGLVGYGFGGRHFHAPLLQSAKECEFLGVVTSSAERRSLIAQELPGRFTFANLEELAAAGADAVAISTPADTHVPLTQQALRLGLAVVCDKPFALDAASARETVELAEKLGLPLSVYQNRRWDSDFLTVRRLLQAGSLGDVVRFESRFERYQPQPGPPAAGGGTLLDFGSHLVDQALVLFGPATSVYAEVRSGSPSGLDDDVFLALTHRRGVRSHLSGSWVQGAPGARFRLSGTAGSYLVDGVDVQEDLLLAGRTPADEHGSWGAEPATRRSSIRRGETAEDVALERGRWDRFYPAFAAAVSGTGTVPVDPRDAVATATVLDAARHSARLGTSIVLDEESRSSSSSQGAP